MALKAPLGRSLASLCMLGLAGYLCLATSPLPEPPSVHARLDVPMGPLETTRRIRVLMAGVNLDLSVATLENVQASLESASVPLERGSCRDQVPNLLCLHNPAQGFAELVVRIDRSSPAAEPVTFTVFASVQEGEPRDVPSDLVSVHVHGVDLELLP